LHSTFTCNLGCSSCHLFGVKLVIKNLINDCTIFIETLISVDSCVIVEDGKVIASGRNRTTETRNVIWSGSLLCFYIWSSSYLEVLLLIITMMFRTMDHFWVLCLSSSALEAFVKFGFWKFGILVYRKINITYWSFVFIIK